MAALASEWAPGQRSAEQIRPESYSARVRRDRLAGERLGHLAPPTMRRLDDALALCSATAHNERPRRGAARTPGPVR